MRWTPKIYDNFCRSFYKSYEWNTYFSWFPVKIGKEIVWWENIERKRVKTFKFVNWDDSTHFIYRFPV